MSGIYIKGMQMPTSCRACPFATRFFDGEDVCAMLGTYVHDRDREDDCPLVPVPDHGDLVDKQRMAETNEQHYKVYEGEAEADYARKVVLRMLDQAPTVIPADKGVTE